MSNVIGLDFGTTNSAIAVGDMQGHVALAKFGRGSKSTSTFRSILYFPAREPGTPNPKAIGGPEAISAYLDADTKGRLVLSVKSYLASRLFTNTSIYGRSYTLEDLIAVILKKLKEGAVEQFGDLGSRVVVGRPVHFASAETEEDESLAIGRLRGALQLAGFQDVTFEFEPIAAAYHYEKQPDHDELVLIGDFGGGTSDFSLVRLGPSRRSQGHSHSDILGTDGVGIAGDVFDSEIMIHLVAPRLGMGSHYVSLGKELPVPVWIYTQLSSWHRMSFLRDPSTMKVLKEVRSQAQEREKIDALIHVITYNLGYELYRAVEHVKVELTDQETAHFRFQHSSVDINEKVDRWQFESWIQKHIQAIQTCVDRLMSRCNVTAQEVDSVFLTGGSSFVPVVRRLFAKKFGDSRLRGGEELTTVAKGLALRALDLR
jgi:hypothetical chaperone protein